MLHYKANVSVVPKRNQHWNQVFEYTRFYSDSNTHTSTLNTRDNLDSKNKTKERKHNNDHAPLVWGVFGDIHFQDRNLNRIEETGRWLVSELERQRVDAVVCLGDILNTRETVSVQALSSATDFLDRLSRVAPVHVILGNHDMNLKHSHRISSLDVLDMKGVENIHLYRHITPTNINGVPVVLLPYHEHVEDIQRWMSSFISQDPFLNANHIAHAAAFVHMSIPGAVKRYQKDNKRTFSRIFTPPIDDGIDNGNQPSVNSSGKEGIKRKSNNSNSIQNYGDTNELAGRIRKNKFGFLDEFRHVISGHFHHHHFVTDNIGYAGAPMQHHFGDSGDDQRGYLLYYPPCDVDPNATLRDCTQFVQNPKWNAFSTLRISSMEELDDAIGRDSPEGKHYSIIYESSDINHDQVQQRLLNCGAREARRHSVLIQQISIPTFSESTSSDSEKAFESKINSSETSSKSTISSMEKIIEQYVSQFALSVEEQNETERDNNNKGRVLPESETKKTFSFSETVANIGKDIVRTSQKKYPEMYNMLLSSTGDAFHGRIRKLVMENFLGIQEKTVFNFRQMADGVWFLEGPNGAGKSTFMEAIVWCLFEKFLRSDMKVSFAVNDFIKKNCRVRIDFENGYSIERFRKYNGDEQLKGSGVRVYHKGTYLDRFERGSARESQKAIEELIGIDYSTFTKSIILGDSAMTFLTSDANTRRELIEELLEMRQFDWYLKETRSRKTDIREYFIESDTQKEMMNTEIDRMKQELNREHRTLEELSQDYDHVNHKIHDHIKNREVELENQQKELKKWFESELLQEWKLHQNHAEAEKALNELKNQYQEYQTQSEALKVELEHNEKIVSNFRTASKEREQLNDLKQRKWRLEHLLEQNSIQLEMEIKQFNELNASLSRMEELVHAGKCPTCSQDVTQDTFQAPITSVEERMKEVKESWNYHEKEQKEVRDHLMKVTADIDRDFKNVTDSTLVRRESQYYHAQQEKTRISSQIDELDSKIKSVLEEISRIKSEFGEELPSTSWWNYGDRTYDQVVSERQEIMNENWNKLIKEKYDLESKLNQIDALIKDSNDRVSRLMAQIENRNNQVHQIKERQDSQQNKLRAIEFWEKGFDKRMKSKRSGGIPTLRSFVLERSIRDLNDLLRDYNEILGAKDDLEISFDTDLRIRQDFGKRSGGQRKRNNLAIMFALFELVRQRSRFLSDFMMIDEVFDALDREGQDAVRSVIGMISQRISKIFVITHSPLMDRSANIIHVEMKKSGTQMTF